MLSVGLDVSGQRIVAYAVTERKRCMLEGASHPSRAGVRRLIQQLGAGAKLVAVEAGNQLKWVAEPLKRVPEGQGHVVHPNEVKWITESRGKTDRGDAKTLAELARAGLLPRAVHVGDGVGRERREWVSARQQLQAKRVALINALRGCVYQEGRRVPEKFFSGVRWPDKLARRPVTPPVKWIIDTFMTSIEALAVAERQLTERRLALEEPRWRV